MKNKWIALGAIWIVGASALAQVKKDTTALDEVVVSATSKFELPRKDSGKPVIKITRETLASQQPASLADLLNQYAGIEINGARSNAGQNLGYFIRGGSTSQVLFLIDGAQVNDPSNISGEFDLRLLDLDQVEEIEILKGASSTLYGANASTTVINIKLRKAPKSGTKMSLSSFVGTNKSAGRSVNGIDEFNSSFQLQGRHPKGLTYGLGFNHQSTDGLSAAQSQDEAEVFESDPFNRVNLLGRIGFDNKNNFRLSSYLSFDEYKVSFDQGAFTDALQNETYSRQVRWGTNVNWKYAEKGELVYTDVSTHTRRDTRSSFPTLFNADGYSLDLYNKYSFDLGAGSELKSILGFNFKSETYEEFSPDFSGGGFGLVQASDKDDVNIQIYDPYFNLVYINQNGFHLNAGLRYNAHSNYDGALVYSINPSYRIKAGEWTIKPYASYSTAYITPTLFQLYANDFGNDGLEPEQNATLEGGLELIGNKLIFSFSYFQRQEEDLIAFVSAPQGFQYLNVDQKLSTQGIEIMTQYQLMERIHLMANYTFIEREDLPELLRIPKHKVNASLRMETLERLFVTARYQYNHQRAGAFFNNDTFMTENLSLDSYQLVDLDFSYRLARKDLVFFLGISNILDQDYQELAGFQTRGRNYKLGVRLGL